MEQHGFGVRRSRPGSGRQGEPGQLLVLGADRPLRLDAQPVWPVHGQCLPFRALGQPCRGAPAIQLDAGRAIVQACTFMQDGKHVQVGAQVRSALLTSNQAMGGFEFENSAGPRVQAFANEVDPLDVVPGARAHYRLKVGAVGDDGYLRRWHGRENRGTADAPRPCAWSEPTSQLVLPVLIDQPYRLTVELEVPIHAQTPRRASIWTTNVWPPSRPTAGCWRRNCLPRRAVKWCSNCAAEVGFPALSCRIPRTTGLWASLSSPSACEPRTRRNRYSTSMRGTGRSSESVKVNLLSTRYSRTDRIASAFCLPSHFHQTFYGHWRVSKYSCSSAAAWKIPFTPTSSLGVFQTAFAARRGRSEDKAARSERRPQAARLSPPNGPRSESSVVPADGSLPTSDRLPSKSPPTALRLDPDPTWFSPIARGVIQSPQSTRGKQVACALRDEANALLIVART